MNSHENRNVKASSARTTSVIAGEKRGVERQHPLRLGLVFAVAQRKKARAYRAEIDHDEEKRAESVKTEMRAEPRHAERQGEAFRLCLAEKLHRCGNQRNRGEDQCLRCKQYA